MRNTVMVSNLTTNAAILTLFSRISRYNVFKPGVYQINTVLYKWIKLEIALYNVYINLHVLIPIGSTGQHYLFSRSIWCYFTCMNVFISDLDNFSHFQTFYKGFQIYASLKHGLFVIIYQCLQRLCSFIITNVRYILYDIIYLFFALYHGSF